MRLHSALGPRLYRNALLAIGSLLSSAGASAQLQFNVSIPTLKANVPVSVRLGGQPLAASVSPENVHKLFPGVSAPVFIHYMPWWGKKDHIDIGVDEHDPKVLAAQVNAMIARGFDGMVVTESHSGDFNTETTHRIFKAVQEHPGFGFALMYNKGGLSTAAKLIESLRQDDKDYFRSPNYLRRNGKPVVFFFDKPDGIDFSAVKAVAPNVNLVFRNPGGFKTSGADGAFAWMADSSESSDSYFSRFDRAASENSGAFSVASVMKGFDDRLASWSKGRRVDERCGQTFLDNAKHIPRHVDLIQLNTWNDYEEGTDLEHGIDNCGAIQISVSGTKLNLQPSFADSGSLDTVDHFAVYATMDGAHAARLATLPPRDRSFDLASLRLPPGSKIFVQMVGKPLLRNQLSNSVALQP